jgi:HEAT repeat protein
MRTTFLRLFATFLGVALGSSAGFAGEKEEPDLTPFQKTTQGLTGGCGLQMMECGHLPHFASWAKLPKGGDVDDEFIKRCKTFPDDLMKALESREGVDHDAAIGFLAIYAALARCRAAAFSERSLPSATGLALAPHTARIRQALAASVTREKRSETRLMTALALLSLDEGHTEANKALQAGAASADAKLLASASHLIGLAHLTTPQAIDFLGRLLKHRDPAVREAAAGAVITMGTSARDMAPALIAYLETGDSANGQYSPPLAITIPQSGNLALMALESLKEHARPAVPAILVRFEKANADDQVAMLSCLANAGHNNEACLAAARKSLNSKKANVRLAAACTVLHLAPGDRKATDLLKNALADDATRDLAVKTCQQFGPPSREIAASLLPMLNSDTEEVRINAMYALGRIGPSAAESVPGIEKLLATEEDAMTHTFRSTSAAAGALTNIGGKAAAAALLRVAESKSSGARYAILRLPELGDGLPPAALAVLVRIVDSDDPLKEPAAIALSNLGERARPVRHDLQRLLDLSDVGWTLDTALRRIPAAPR